VWAELLPIRSYSTADGLAANRIDRMVVDSRGFVWLCTPEGLSRFDGYRVVTFGAAEGLPGRAVQALLETRSGAYFVGTEGGLEFRAAAGKQQFFTYRVGDSPRENNVTALLQSSDGRIWCGTWGALFEMLPGPRFRRQALPKPPPGVTGIDITDMAEDRCGKLWLGTVSGLYAIARDGAVQRITKDDGLPSDYVNSLLLGRDGRLWAALRGGLALMRDGCTAGGSGVQRVYPVGRNVASLAEGPDSALWSGTINGLVRLLPDGSGSSHRLTRSQGLTDRTIFSLAFDKGGNLWAGTEGAGAMMVEPAGFTTFHEQDGFTSDRIWSVLGDRAGNVLAVANTEDQTTWSLSVFDGARFHSQKAPRVFATYRNRRAWGSHRILLQGRTGEWWGASAGGLCRYAAVKVEGLADRAPDECYFRDEKIFQIFEDSKGGIWASAPGNTASW
jgi:ligand-binding sensor domain-containing protein